MQNTFLLQNHINTATSIEFVDFVPFYEARKQTIREQLKRILNVTAVTITNDSL